jgi:hypothetical protein
LKEEQRLLAANIAVTEQVWCIVETLDKRIQQAPSESDCSLLYEVAKAMHRNTVLHECLEWTVR